MKKGALVVIALSVAAASCSRTEPRAEKAVATKDDSAEVSATVQKLGGKLSFDETI